MNEEVIFLEALQRQTPAERAGYLNQVCAGEPVLRRNVDMLLRAHDKAGSFLAAGPDVGVTQDDSASETPGTAIGPYKLLQQIGEGGMGTVFMAEQTEPVQRRVALKIIKAGMDTKLVIARFEAERQALAVMDHPNIAKVFDAGATENGRPYFVMELVKGVPITKYCDEHRLTPRQRLELFVPVCQAIQHAHQKGIIHRDVKPSNVLVAPYDGKPVVKVIDFGVAKATGQQLTDKTLFTDFGSVVGTMEYMSPEQAELNNQDVDTRSDIYSLGVVLYELLTGTTPLSRARLKGAAFMEMLRMIREEEPPKPSTRLSESKDSLPTISTQRQTEPAKLTRQVRGELDWIVMKALDKDRSRRYETANGFAMDVQRYLADETVLACPPSAGYRFRKIIRRNKGPVVAASLIILALLGGIVGTSLGLIESKRQERLAVAAQEKEATRADAEAKQRHQARKAVDEMYTQVAQKWLAQQPRMEKVQREFLEKALQYYEEFAQEQSTEPAAQLEIASAHRRLGRIYQKLGQPAKAEESSDRALALVGKLVAEFPGVRGYRDELAQTHHDLGYLQMYSNRLEEAEKSFGKALMIYEQMVVDFGVDDARRRDLATARHNLGTVLSGLMGGAGRPNEAQASYRQAVELYKELVANAPDVADDQSSLGGLLSDWANMLLTGGQLAEARPLLKEAISRQKAALKLEPRHSLYRQYLSSHLAGWAEIEDAHGNHDEAVKTAREAFAVQQSLASDFPEIPHYRHAQAERAYDLGRLLKTDSPAEAEATFRQAVSLLEKMVDTFTDVPERSGLLASCYQQLGFLLDAAGHLQKAEADYLASLRWEPKVAATLSALGRNLLKQQKFADAVPLLREGLEIRERKQPDAWMAFETKSLLGGALLGVKKYADAEPLLLAGYEGMKKREERISADEKVHLTEALERLVQLYEATGKKEEATKWRTRLEAQPAAKKKQ